jgi:small-conductance mechanosensitive channel
MNSQSISTSQITLGNIVLLVVSIALVWMVLRYVARAFESITNARPRTGFLFRVVESTLRVLLWLGVLTFAMRLLAPSQNVLLIVIGAAAVAAGLGARDLVKNLIGGLVIMADRSYEVGDRVTMAGASGEIRRIGLGATKITTPNGALVTIPNSKLLDGIAQNDSAGTPECLAVTELFLPADADQDLALRIGREALITCPFLCLRRPVAIALSEGLSQSPYLSLKLKGYVYDHRFESEMQTDLVCRCKAEFRRLGIVCDQRAR